MTRSTVTHDTFVIVRTYDSPVAKVFQAWADPKRKARWFAGSADALGNGYELDFQVGGREVNRGGPPDGPVYTYSAEFRDIVIDQRIVCTIRDACRRHPYLGDRGHRGVPPVGSCNASLSSRSRGCSSTATRQPLSARKGPGPCSTRWPLRSPTDET